ncbi:MAG: hypothetical protein J7K40_12240 [candidate division Zixibacteria bacterium]|nr:hypothetical protein [candidate division Zixibacteria bacterium]
MKLLIILLIIIAGNYNDPVSISKLETQTVSNPDDIQPRLELADIFLSQENFKEAKKYLLQTQKIMETFDVDSCNAKYFYLWGLYYDLYGNIPSAQRYYSKTVECDSNYYDAWRNQGYIYEIFGNYDKMLYCFRRALKTTIDSAGTYYDMGVTCDYLDSLQLAIKYYNAAFDYGEVYPQAYMNIGIDWGMLGYDDSASYYFNKAVEAGLRSPELFYNIGIIMFESGASDEAMDNFMKTLSVDPDYSPAKLQIGNVYELYGDSGMAKVYFEEFVKTAPLIYRDDINRVKEKLLQYNKK